MIVLFVYYLYMHAIISLLPFIWFIHIVYMKVLHKNFCSMLNNDGIISLFKDNSFASCLLRNVLLSSVTIVTLCIKSPSCGNKEETDKPGTEIIIVSRNITVFVHSSGGTGWRNIKNRDRAVTSRDFDDDPSRHVKEICRP